MPGCKHMESQVAAALNEDPEGSIVVEGHTDSTGRAEAVRSFLIPKGVDADRIRAVGLGPSRPVADNPDIESRRPRGAPIPLLADAPQV